MLPCKYENKSKLFKNLFCIVVRILNVPTVNIYRDLLPHAEVCYEISFEYVPILKKHFIMFNKIILGREIHLNMSKMIE